MSKFFFPINYKPKFDQLKTIAFIEIFNNLLIKKIKHNKNAMFIYSPIVSSNNKVLDLSLSYSRKIIFDNKFSNNIFSLNENMFEFLCNKYSSLNLSSSHSLLTKTIYFNRDAELNNTESIQKDVINLFITIPGSLSFESISSNITDELISIINEICTSESLHSYSLSNKRIKYTKKDLLKFRWKSKNNKDRINEIDSYLFDKGPTLFSNVGPQITNEISEMLFFDLVKKDTSCSLYIPYIKANTNLRILKISTGESKTIEETEGRQILIQLDLSNLYMYLLDKVHIAEVVASSWDDKFIEFIKNNNIQIF